MNGVAVVAGSVATALFAVSALPMLYKAARTRDLGSYSFGNLLLANVGNGFYAVYVFSMPVGPIWALHSFYMLSSALMLFWYLGYEVRSRRRGSAGVDPAPSGSSPPETRPAPIALHSSAGASSRGYPSRTGSLAMVPPISTLVWTRDLGIQVSPIHPRSQALITQVAPEYCPPGVFRHPGGERGSSWEWTTCPRNPG
jgi:hypothetical protein